MFYIIFFIIKSIWSIYKAQKIICKPPNDFIQVFAPPGTGKTTLAAYLVKKAINENKKIFSNVPIIGANLINIPNDLGKYEIKDTIILIDEAGTDLANRDWKNNLTKKQIRFIKKHRHYNVDIWLFSQSYNDVDNKFRELTTKLYLLEKSIIPFKIKLKAIRKKIDIIDGKIIEIFYFSIFENESFFIPKCWAYFNSWDKDEELEKIPKNIYTKLSIYERRKFI